ncbi:hypothetical protein ACPCSE_29650 [Streptomyces cellulosae]
MPVLFDTARRFDRDLKKLDPGKRDRVKAALKRFVEDLETGQFRAGLRVKAVQGTKTTDGDAIFELTWAKPDGRATWQYGDENKPGQPHVIMRRVGGHEIFDPGPS